MKGSQTPLNISQLPKIKSRPNLRAHGYSSLSPSKSMLGQMLKDAYDGGFMNNIKLELDLSQRQRSSGDACLDKSAPNLKLVKENQRPDLDFALSSSPISNVKQQSRTLKDSNVVSQLQSNNSAQASRGLMKKKVQQDESKPQLEFSDSDLAAAAKQDAKTIEALKKENSMLRERVAYFKKRSLV